MTDTYEVYLVLRRFRDSVDRYHATAGALSRVGLEYLSGAEIFYQPTTDTALLGLHFTPYALMHLGEDSIHLLAHRSRLPMIVPAQLDAAQRQSFLEQLSSYPVYIEPNPDEAAGQSPGVHAIERLARRVACLSDVSALGCAESTQELPLFRPWWERASTSDLPGH